jgi:hypothetical protein
MLTLAFLKLRMSWPRAGVFVILLVVLLQQVRIYAGAKFQSLKARHWHYWKLCVLP